MPCSRFSKGVPGSGEKGSFSSMIFFERNDIQFSCQKAPHRSKEGVCFSLLKPLYQMSWVKRGTDWGKWYSVLSGPHAPTTGQARSPAPAGRTWSPALLVLCTSIHRFSRSREGRPRRSRRDNAGCCRSWGGARGRWGPVSWSVAAAFDRQGKAIGCEPPARDERVCPPGGEPSRVYGYRSFCPLGGRDGFVCGESPTSLGSETRTSGEPPVVRSLRAHALHSALFPFPHPAFPLYWTNTPILPIM